MSVPLDESGFVAAVGDRDTSRVGPRTWPDAARRGEITVVN
jgi:hypothetical protein